MTLLNKPLMDLHNDIAKRDVKVSEVVQASLQRIKEVDSDVKAFLRIEEESAMARAEQLDKQLVSSSEMGILAGLPVGIKDNISTKGIITTCASKMLQNYEPVFDATVMTKLHKAEAIIVGKTNMDEFAMGCSNENSAYHITRNPWELGPVPGGSREVQLPL